jgi:hypothetical protein
VFIQGTTVGILVLGGRYEGQIGYMTLSTVPPNVDTRVHIRVGFTEANAFIPPRCLWPHRTTARPGFVPLEDARPVISVLGERVVIIGADVSGNSDWIGEYGRVVQCEFPPPPASACVQALSGPSLGHLKFFHENSLCRSWQLL